MRAEFFAVTNFAEGTRRHLMQHACCVCFSKSKANFEGTCSEDAVLTFLTDTISRLIDVRLTCSKVTVMFYNHSSTKGCR